jgi:transcriptional regulator with PAS, ATPase and Fis domain
MPHGTETVEMLAWKEDFAQDLVGSSRPLLDQLKVARRVADTDCTVLITGETGTGKELLAHALHAGSARREGPFVAINCAAIPDDLIEDELFGHVAGSFSGATKERAGKIAKAHGGTLFLDEVGELPARAQAKLLRVLQERLVTPLGADDPIEVDVRILVATHRNLEAMVAEGTFREDLYYRLDVVSVDLPPLRERGRDIVELALEFLHSAARQYNRNVTGFSAEAEVALMQHDWPGNVRELKNAVDRAVLLARSHTIAAGDLGLTRGEDTSATDIATSDLDLKKALQRTEHKLIEKALEKTQGNRTEAAALLGLNRTTLVEKLKRAT